MADVIDCAGEIEDRLLELRITARRTQGRELYPAGKCHWCNTLFGGDSPNLFCDSSCSTDWEKRRR